MKEFKREHRISLLLAAVLVLVTNCTAQVPTTSVEQLALSHFVDSVFTPELSSKYSKVLFNERIDGKKSGGDFNVCFKDYYQNFPSLSADEKKAIVEQREQYAKKNYTAVKLPHNVSNIVASDQAIAGKRQAILTVRKADIYSPGKFFVEIILSDKRGQDRFAFEILDNKVTRSCKGFVAF